MDNNINKYFADELTQEEKQDFLLEVHNDDELRGEFIENQHLMALVDWASPAEEQAVAQLKLTEFIYKMKAQKINNT